MTRRAIRVNAARQEPRPPEATQPYFPATYSTTSPTV